MKRPVLIEPDALSRDTVECLEQLLERAKRGEIIGLAFAAMCRRRRYFLDTAGEAHRNPTFARGMIAALDDELGMRLRT